MKPPSKLLFDMNVLRYLDQLGILTQCISMIKNPYTLDLIKEKEMMNPSWEDVEKGGMKTLGLSGKQMLEAEELRGGHKKLSIYDAGIIILAAKKNYPLFTEDRKMITEMERLGIRHICLPEMIDLMYQNGIISKDEAHQFIEMTQSTLLQKRYDEYCVELLEKYS